MDARGKRRAGGGKRGSGAKRPAGPKTGARRGGKPGAKRGQKAPTKGKARSKPGAKPAAKRGPTRGTKPGGKRGPAKRGGKPGAKTGATRGPRPVIKGKAGTKRGAKGNAKRGPRPSAKRGPPRDAKPGVRRGGKPGPKRGATSSSKPGARRILKPTAKRGSTPDVKPGDKRGLAAKRGSRPSAKRGPTQGAKTGVRRGGKPGPRPAARRGATSSSKPGAKRGSTYSSKPGAARISKPGAKIKTGGRGGAPGVSRGKTPGKTATQGERIQKILARAGFGSRRGCEEIILEGRVRVNGRVVMELGSRADASRDTITVGGRRIRLEPVKYYVVNKPKNVISTTADDKVMNKGRRRVIDLVPERPRVNPVGRLDVESEGLMLLTNDGDLANRLTHPRYGIERVYRAAVRGKITEEALATLRRGVRLAEGRTLPPKVRVVHKDPGGGRLEVVIKEGINREVRRILAAVGLKVKSLKRIRLGPLSLGGIASGTARDLTAFELARLREATSGPGEPPPPWLRRRRRRDGNPRDGR